MTDENKHRADGPEQEITSDAAELLDPEPTRTPEVFQAQDLEVASDETAGTEKENDPQAEGESAVREVPAPKLERLQKILAQAGIASRRHAEEMITGGRVQVNGQIVSTLGSKADAARDHIRVDGKLLQGAERQRYFMLNKPRGFVTTVTDPEGRPTVMQFFAKATERLYPVGRLDYLSEGLLVITNDGDLANQLTKAASGVEKTYLVKVAGQPAEEALDRLREGVSIERGHPEERDNVQTAPARIRQVRKGDNPWYEVVLIEGRNRELRKMFEEIGHHVEKIRRVGYGPLVLDVEPGNLRELEPEEVQALRLTAAGKLKPRRPKSTKLLPKNAGKTISFEDKKSGKRGPERDSARLSREDQRAYGGGRPSPSTERSPRPYSHGPDRARPDRPRPDRPFRPSGDRPAGDRAQRFERGPQQRSTGPRTGRSSDRSPGQPSYPARGGEGSEARRPAGSETFRTGASDPTAYGAPPSRPGPARPGSTGFGSDGPSADRRDSPRPTGSGFATGPRRPQRPFNSGRPSGGSPRPPQKSGFSLNPGFRAKPGVSTKPSDPGKPDVQTRPAFNPRPESDEGPKPASKPRLEITPQSDQPSRSGEREASARKPFVERSARPASHSTARPPSRGPSRGSSHPTPSARRDLRPGAPSHDRGFSERPQPSGTRPPRAEGPGGAAARPFHPTLGRPGSSRPGPGKPGSAGSGHRGKPSGTGPKRSLAGDSSYRGKPGGGAKRPPGRPAGKRSGPVRGAKRPGGRVVPGKKRK